MGSEVTVVMPTLPHRRDLRERALSSIWAQTVAPEAVFVIAGLTPWDARNRGLDATDTRWVAWCDDDDYWLPHHLETLLAEAARTKADLVYPTCRVEANGKLLPGWVDLQPFGPEGHFAVPISYLVDAELARWVGGFPERYEDFDDNGNNLGASDYQFLRALHDKGAVFAYTKEITWVIGLHSDNRYTMHDD